MVTVPLPANSVKVQFKAVRGSTDDSDVAIDDILLTPDNCNGN